MKDNQKSLSLLADRVLLAGEQQEENVVFLAIDVCICSSAINGNNEGVTSAFMQDIVNRSDEFVGLPLYADVDRLLAKEYDNLTHLYNKFTRKFDTTQIGGLTNFRMVNEDGVEYLQATARVPKRESEICERLTEMYEMGKLCFSFEVVYRVEDTHLGANGANIIDVGPNNAILGLAVVSRPAYQTSVALDLVAELDDGGEPTAERGETETMPKEQMNAEQVEEIVAEEVKAEEEHLNAEDQEKPEDEDMDDKEPEAPEDEDDEIATAEDAGVAQAEDATAEVVMHRVELEQTYRKGDPRCGEPDTVCTETTETVVETVDEEAPVATAEEDEKDRVIAELKTRIAELEVIEVKYNEIMKAEAAKALAEKQNKARAFAEKQGLDVSREDVANAIAELNYEAIANLSMEQAEVAVAEQEEEKEPEIPAYFQMASYVDMDIKDNGEYGDMLSPVSK